MPDETREQTREALVRVIGDAHVQVEPIEDYGYGPYSPPDGVVPDGRPQGGRRRCGRACRSRSSMGTGATDSRHLRSMGILAYGVSPLVVSHADGLAGHVAHGPDERRPARWVGDGARFLREVVYELAR